MLLGRGKIVYYSRLVSRSNDYRRALVASQFHQARRRAALESILARFSGRPVALLSFDDVIDKLGLSGQSSAGVTQIDIDAIVGSVGRYQDFTRTFLPRLESDEDRWVKVGAAAPSVADLPPIDVYKIGEVYFVLDGNHRVSLARTQNLRYIDARVTEVRTRVPMPPGADPNGLIIAAEQREFLAYSRLNLTRPGADLRVSVPGQYRHLESHIEAFRFIREESEGRDIPFDEAAARWYDEAYLPLVEAIREQGILRYFPGRTETDFFVWLARHRAELESVLGVAIAPDVAVARLLSRVREAKPATDAPLVTRLRRLTRLEPADPGAAITQRTWAQERALGRYSDHLFAAFLHPLVLDETNGRTAAEGCRLGLATAMALCEAESAHFYALLILDHDPPTAAESATIDAVRRMLAAQPFRADLLIERGDPVEWTKRVGFLNDLVVLERDFAQAPGERETPSRAVRAIVGELQRPILITGGATGSGNVPPVPRRVLLVHDTRRALDEAVFIGAYLAERWRADITILPLSNGRDTQERTHGIAQYLALHEVTATFLDPARPDRAAEAVAYALAHNTAAGEFDLLLITGPDRGRKSKHTQQQTEQLWSVMERWPHPVLIAA